MIAASSLAFPGSRTLAGWWRQLAPHQPRALWVGYLFVHRVEALALLHQPKKVDRFSRLLLEALELSGRNGRPADAADVLQQLNDRLFLGRQVLHQSLRLLEEQGLVRQEPPADWRLTPLGQQGLAHEEYPALAIDRRVFSFLERLADNGTRRLPPHYVNLGDKPAVPWTADPEHPFDVNLLFACTRQPDAWKQAFGFPREVANILGPGADLESLPRTIPPPPDWQRVVLDRPERMLAALILTGNEPGTLQIFAARQEGWTLHAEEPLGSVAESWKELLPVLAEENPLAAWQMAWRAWGQQRGLPASVLESCKLTIAGECLKIEAPQALLDQLRAARHEVLKGETWLLAGEGLLRPAARLLVQETV